MADDEFLTASIDDYLLSLADGICEAQRQLSQLRIPGQFGQPATMYQLPRVDFELKMSFEMTKRTGPKAENPTVAGGSGNASGRSTQLRCRPVNPQSGSAQSATKEAASIIKGSFVSVPIQGGKPPAVIRISLERLSARQVKIYLEIHAATGEVLKSTEAQFNLDRDLSNRLNESMHLPSVHPETQLMFGTVITDEEGEGFNILDISEQEVLGSNMAVVVDVQGETETIVIKATA